MHPPCVCMIQGQERDLPPPIHTDMTGICHQYVHHQKHVTKLIIDDTEAQFL